MSIEDDVREILNEAVQEIAQAQNNPRTWLCMQERIMKDIVEITMKTKEHREEFVHV